MLTSCVVYVEKTDHSNAHMMLYSLAGLLSSPAHLSDNDKGVNGAHRQRLGTQYDLERQIARDNLYWRVLHYIINWRERKIASQPPRSSAAANERGVNVYVIFMSTATTGRWRVWTEIVKVGNI